MSGPLENAGPLQNCLNKSQEFIVTNSKRAWAGTKHAYNVSSEYVQDSKPIQGTMIALGVVGFLALAASAITFAAVHSNVVGDVDYLGRIKEAGDLGAGLMAGGGLALILIGAGGGFLLYRKLKKDQAVEDDKKSKAEDLREKRQDARDRQKRINAYDKTGKAMWGRN
jgi:hypothetical protein